MASHGDKKWDRPWSMDEMIENAENWSLAGDVALLNSIKAYADNLLTKTLSISNNVDDLLKGLDEVGLKLEISHNEFQSLRNTQFIESRVYEDDETLDIKEEVKEEEKVLTEEDKQNMIREATLEGLKVMDKYFDKVEVSISDSEDESEKSYILQPKDLYVVRPLPLVIGTEDWYKKWHVGLAETSSEDESDKESEKYSDSDSDDHLPKDLLKGSETSSELDFSSHANENRPVANSTFNDTTKQPDIFESDESGEQDSVPVKASISNKNFAEQLAEKLGNVISEREEVTPEINRRPIQPAQPSQFVGNLFPDEPPPLDELDDTILPKSAQTGLFSGGEGLFDDNEDELFWGQPNRSSKVKVEEKRTENKQEMPPEMVRHVSLVPKSSHVSKGLFDSDDSSDEDLFATNKKISKPPYLQPFKTTAPLFDEEPPELDTQKKPEEPKKVEKTEPDVAVPKDSSSKEKSKPKPVSLFDDDLDNKVDSFGATKKINLFDDDDDLFKDDLFTSLTPKKITSSLFDAEETETLPRVDLFNESVEKIDYKQVKTVQKDSLKAKKVASLFSDEEEEEKPSNVSKTVDSLSQLVSSKNEEPEVSNGVPDKAEATGCSISESLSERQVIGAEKKAVDKKMSKGLFDDDLEDDLYKNKDVLSTPPEPIPEPPRKVEISLFGSTPPPDDGDWDSKSDNFSDSEDQFSYRIDGNTGASSLFDNEPPSLGPNDSSGIVRDQNVTRVDTDDSSFYPYASSSRRLSSDIFNEEQSQDNFFITKSKTESFNIVPPPLDIIPEDTKASLLDITPSGNPSDLEDSKDKSLTADSVFEENLPETPKKPLSLFDDDDLDDSERLFSPRPEKKPLPKLSEKRLSLFDNVDNILSENNQMSGNDSVQITKAEELKRDELKKSPEKSKIAGLIDQIQNEPVKEQPSLSAGSPRKLKHNLNINVNALLPGYAPPKLKELSKSHSLELPKDRGDTPSPEPPFFTPQPSIRPERPPAAGPEKAVSFGDALDNVEVLHSITKDRAKIPIKRRPSTRRGRREAISKSSVDLSMANDEIIASRREKSKEIEQKTEELEQKIEENKAVKVEVESLRKDVLPEQPKGPEQETQKSTVRDIFEGDGDSDEDLFPNLAGKTSRKPKNAIFDSEDSDGDLFGIKTAKKQGRDSKQEKATGVTRKPLFNDSGSSDDDLFSASSKSDGRKKDQWKPVGKKPQASSGLRKLENIQTDEDPLSSLLK